MTTDTLSKTPRVDAVHTRTLGGYNAMLTLAGQLERELTSAQEQIATLTAQLEQERRAGEDSDAQAEINGRAWQRAKDRAESAEAKLREAEQREAALRKDAERYRWLKYNATDIKFAERHVVRITMNCLDDIIDALAAKEVDRGS